VFPPYPDFSTSRDSNDSAWDGSFEASVARYRGASDRQHWVVHGWGAHTDELPLVDIVDADALEDGMAVNGGGEENGQEEEDYGVHVEAGKIAKEFFGMREVVLSLMIFIWATYEGKT